LPLLKFQPSYIPALFIQLVKKCLLNQPTAHKNIKLTMNTQIYINYPLLCSFSYVTYELNGATTRRMGLDVFLTVHHELTI